METSVIPTSLAPELDRLVGEQEGSLYDLLGREYGLVDEFEEQYLEVIMPTQEERRLLSIASRTQVVRIRGLSMDKAGTPFDCFEQLYPAAEFAFAISGTTSRHLLPTPGFQDWDVRSLPAAARDDATRRRPGPRSPRSPGLATQGNHWPPVGPCERKRPCPRHQAASRGSTSPEQPTPAGSRRTRCGPATS